MSKLKKLKIILSLFTCLLLLFSKFQQPKCLIEHVSAPEAKNYHFEVFQVIEPSVTKKAKKFGLQYRQITDSSYAHDASPVPQLIKWRQSVFEYYQYLSKYKNIYISAYFLMTMQQQKKSFKVLTQAGPGRMVWLNKLNNLTSMFVAHVTPSTQDNAIFRDIAGKLDGTIQALLNYGAEGKSEKVII